MRKEIFDRWLAGTVLALIVGAPGASISAPDRVQSLVPLPPSLNGQLPRHRDAAPLPQPAATAPQPSVPQNSDVAPPQGPKRDLATAQSNQEILRRVERREAQNPFAFFERLFR